MNSNHDLYLDLCASLAVGSIEPTDLRVLEEHLAGGCVGCRAFLQDASAPIEALAFSLPQAKPGRGLKARVMVAVSQAAHGGRASSGPAALEPQGRSLRLVPGWVWAAAALLLVVAAAGWWRAASLGERVDELDRQRAAVSEPPLDADAELSAFLAAKPHAQVLELAANEKGEKSRRARVAYDAGSRTALAHFENFAAPGGRDFEVWTIRDGKPVSEGLVRVDPRGRGVKRLENTGAPAALTAFAISSEVRGGSRDRQTPEIIAYLSTAPK